MPKTKTKSVTKSSSSSRLFKAKPFNRVQALLVLLVVAVIGVVVIYKSQAASVTNWKAMLNVAKCPYNSAGIPATQRFGNSGYCVAMLQFLLYRGGANQSINTTHFDAKTKLYVQEFQQENGLAADGIVGPATWLKLDNCTIADVDRNGVINAYDFYVTGQTAWSCRKL